MHYLLIQSRECMEFILCSLLTNFSEANWEKYLFLKKKERKENQQYEKQTKDKKFTIEEIKNSMER